MTAPTGTISEAPHVPTGPWLRRVWEALKLAAENVRLRRDEHAAVDDWYEDIDRLTATDNRKGQP